MFGVEPPTIPDGGVAGPPTCFGPGDVVEFPLLADTYLADGSPRGEEAIARVEAGTVLLARFDPGDVKFSSFTLTLSHAGSAVGCGGGSESCEACALGTMGSLSVFLTRPDWDERAATHTLRAPGVPWAAPGATGLDRSTSLVAPQSYAGSDFSTLAFALPSSFDPSWPAGFSILVSAESTAAAAIFGTREGAGACDRAQAPKVIATCYAASTCGNGALDPGEDCDDGNNLSGDACSRACRLEGCGNGIQELQEECDDGNNLSGDGCSATCTCEATCVRGGLRRRSP